MFRNLRACDGAIGSVWVLVVYGFWGGNSGALQGLFWGFRVEGVGEASEAGPVGGLRGIGLRVNEDKLSPSSTWPW